MQQWRVRDVMTTEVITAGRDASLADIVTLFQQRRISAVPITDEFDVVIGMVSWTDLQDKVEVDAPPAGGRGWRRWLPSLLQWPHGTAAEVMTVPVLTIDADASLAAAARVMHGADVGRLLVVDEDSRLRGIVTRSDLLKPHDRPDSVIREEVEQRVLGDTLRVPSGAVQVSVDDGAVTLAGRIESKSTAMMAIRLAEAVPGVTDVVARLTVEPGDTVPVRPAVPVQPARQAPAQPAGARGLRELVAAQ